MKAQVKMSPTFLSIEQANDTISLLLLIRSAGIDQSGTTYLHDNLNQIRTQVTNSKQEAGQTLLNYYETFVETVKMAEGYGVTFGTDHASLAPELVTSGFTIKNSPSLTFW